MAPVDAKAEVVNQRFRFRISGKLQLLPADFVNSSEERYILWTDVQEKLGRTRYLTNIVDNKQRRVLFEVDKDYRVLEPLCIARTNRTYAVVLDSDLNGHNDQSGLYEIRNAYREYRDLHNTLDWYCKSKNRDYFLRVLANIEHLHQSLLREVYAYDGNSDPVEVVQLRKDLFRYQQYTLQVEFTSECYSLLRNTTQSLELSAPRLFIVLPDLDIWNDADPATHRFRLYFLCDFKFDKTSTNSSSEETQSIHLSNHEGYNLDIEQTTKFCQQYGHYALTILRMVKDGFSDYQYNVPKLENMPGLNSIRSVSGQPFSKASLGDAVDKSIAYFQTHSTKQRCLAPWLNARDTQRIELFLNPHEVGCNKVGGLYLSIQNSSTRWLCKNHAYNALDIPRGYNIDQEGWNIDQSQNKISKSLATLDEAKAFLEDITYVKQLFELSITLGWEAPPAFLFTHWKEINRSSVKVLHVNGIVDDSDTRSVLRGDDFVGLLKNSSDLGLVHLRNYPKAGEQYTCLRGLDNVYFGIRSKLMSERPGINWVDLSNNLNHFLQQIGQGHRNVLRALRELSISLAQQTSLDLVAIDFFDGKTTKWSGQMILRHVDDVREVDLTDAVIPGVFPQRILEYGTLRRVVVQSSDATNLAHLQNLMRLNTCLEQVKIQILEDEMLPRLAELCAYYNCDPGPLSIVLFEKAMPTEGRDFAHLLIQKMGSRELAQVVKVEFWDCDCVLGALERRHMAILDAVSDLCPNVLASFTLDVSKLSLKGLDLLEGVIKRSTIERLHIRCVKVRDARKSNVGKVLAATQWTSLKSLVLSGDNIDAWIRLWEDHGKLTENSVRWIRQWPYGPRLMRLELQGTGVTEEQLSHQSLLVLYRLVYCFRPVQLKLDNVVHQELKDATLLESVKQRVGGALAEV